MKVAAKASGPKSREGSKARPLLSGPGYQKLKRTVVLATAAVALVPLLVVTLVSYFQYSRALEETARHSMSRLLTNNKQSIEFFLTERRSALNYIIRSRSFEELCQPGALGRIVRNMNESFPLGAFVDLGIIDSTGTQRCYHGPFDLVGRTYSDQRWFQQVSLRGVYISEVFLGHRNSPHIAIATRQEGGDEGYYVLRATFDAEMLASQIHSSGLRLVDDIFLINRDGVLQTRSRRYGAVLEEIPLDRPHNTPGVEVVDHEDEQGRPIFLGYAGIAESPFVLVYVKPAVELASAWRDLAPLYVFVLVSGALILAVVLWGSGQFVRRIRTENLRRASLMHKVEYSNKLASIGRLAAGVAHEVNNPLAVINEKTGLLKDLVSMREEEPNREKYLGIIDSVLRSVERCTKITHRLLGFARRMDVSHEEIDLRGLLEEVVGFLGREAEYRNIQIEVELRGNPPPIVSDRGQLQQVFLNLLNNAVGAVQDGGKIRLVGEKVSDNRVAVTVADDGMGIPEENLNRIFEPFFTTKEGSGTGLGLSITYGIVTKLGGELSVESEVGEGTQFRVELPLAPEE